MSRLAKLLEREGTGISWADLTMNFWIGCQEVSPACDHCYAREFTNARLNASAAKHGRPLVVWGPGGARVQTSVANRRKPLRWQGIAARVGVPAESGVILDVFCSSLSDWADNAVPDEWRAEIADRIRATPNLRWMMLTKRIGNVASMLRVMFPDGVPDNLALGITLCNQKEADRDLMRAVAVKRALGITRLFLSIEPILGAIDLPRHLMENVDLVIVGGESGKGARPMHPGWPTAIQKRCEETGTAFHFKQWGEFRPYADERGVEGFWLDPNGSVYQGPTQWPPAADEPRAYMLRVGVRRAGRELNGREYQERF